ncbi:MAG: hypothetical protein DA408_21385 [Bacteroidetes bacterium]|nr:MAG: hypothetical protein C7N36_20235 [Bacteroidota bacterium]PTM07882.1 MAG: hypothetical protein DA408_21385 [Bacteroidota bacterium]
MRLTPFGILFLSFFCYTCASHPPLAITNGLKDKCRGIYLQHDFGYQELVGAISVVAGTPDTVAEARYHCVYNAYYIAAGLYNRFGAWSQAAPYASYHENTVLIWKNLQLLPDDTTRYTVATGGYEGNSCYSLVHVFNQDGQDMLEPNALHQEQLRKYFGKLIKKSTTDIDQFNKAFKE